MDRDLAETVGLLAGDAVVTRTLNLIGEAAPAGAWLVSGALYGAVWNTLTGRPAGHGLKDLDIIYFDASDLSWEAEDRAARRLAAAAPLTDPPIELRNQARVHLWYRARFGAGYPRLTSALRSLDYYPATAQALAARLSRTGIELHAPFGCADVLNLRLRPNRRLPNAASYERKAARIATLWPEVGIEPW